MPSKSRSNGDHAINFSWLLQLRWGAIAGQLALILGVQFALAIDLPLAPLFLFVAIEAASNAAFGLRLRRSPPVEPWMPGLIMGLDIILLTAMLRLTGGPFNPFTTLYLVNIALAAVVLPATWNWFLTALSLGCFGLLFLDPRLASDGMGHADHMQMHVQGMWVAFGVAAGFIVYFVQRVTRALAARDEELAEAHALTARNEKLASLATLAAGAAHQLSTPLSTIAVVAKELEHQLERMQAAGAAVADARLIREQVERCRDILLQLATDAGASTGEAPQPTQVAELLHVAARGLPPESIVLSISTRAQAQPLYAPPRALAQALRGILKNACEASPAGSPVQVRVEREGSAWTIEVADRGHGMDGATLEHAGEPFFTTKGPEHGMGLGVFLARTVVEGLGGSFLLDSDPGRGTRVHIQLPAEAMPPPQARRGAAPAAA